MFSNVCGILYVNLCAVVTVEDCSMPGVRQHMSYVIWVSHKSFFTLSCGDKYMINACVFLGYCSSHLVCLVTAHDICTISVHLVQSSRDAPLQVQPSVASFFFCCVWDMTPSLSDALIVFVTYLFVCGFVYLCITNLETVGARPSNMWCRLLAWTNPVYYQHVPLHHFCECIALCKVDSLKKEWFWAASLTLYQRKSDILELDEVWLPWRSSGHHQPKDGDALQLGSKGRYSSCAGGR